MISFSPMNQSQELTLSDLFPGTLVRVPPNTFGQPIEAGVVSLDSVPIEETLFFFVKKVLDGKFAYVKGVFGENLPPIDYLLQAATPAELISPQNLSESGAKPSMALI